MLSANGPELVVRPSRASRVAFALILGPCIAIGCGMIVAPGAKVGVRIAGCALGVGLGIVLSRALRLSVTVDDEGVVLRDWWRDRRFAWRTVRDVQVRRGANVLPTATIHLVLDDGRVARLQPASASTLFRRTTFVHEAAAAMRDRVAAKDR